MYMCTYIYIYIYRYYIYIYIHILYIYIYIYGYKGWPKGVLKSLTCCPSRLDRSACSTSSSFLCRIEDTLAAAPSRHPLSSDLWPSTVTPINNNNDN